MMQRNNVCPPISLLTDNDVREMISPELISMCADAGPSRVALAIGCEEKTVRRARDKETLLRASTIFNMLARKATALDGILANFGLRAAPVSEVAIDVASIPCNVAETVPTLIRLFADGDASDGDIRQLDREGVIERFVELADMMVMRRDEIRLRVVSK